MRKLPLDKGLVSQRLTIIHTMQLALGEAAGPFLMIEPLMRHIAEIHPPMETKVTLLIQAAKNTNNISYRDYWNCDSKYLVGAIESEFGSVISKEELQYVKDYPSRRDKFVHGVYPALMTLMQIEPSSLLQTGPNQFDRLKQGEIYESLLSMQTNGVFSKLRIYSNYTIGTLEKIVNSLAK